MSSASSVSSDLSAPLAHIQKRTPAFYQFIPPYMEKDILAFYKKEKEDGAPGWISFLANRVLGSSVSLLLGDAHPVVVTDVATMGEALFKLQKESMQKILGVDFKSDHLDVRPAYHSFLGWPYYDVHLAGLLTDFSMTHETSPIEIFDNSDEKKPLQRYRKANESPSPSVLHDSILNLCFDNVCEIDSFFRKILTIVPINQVAHTASTMRVKTRDATFFNSANWSPEDASVYLGQVDPRLFKPFIESVEITMHEFGHAVTYYGSNLNYFRQSGALNESISDVFTIMFKHFNSKSKAEDPTTSWLIGEGILVNAEEGDSLRSMKSPGTAFRNHIALKNDSQPKEMSEYVETSEDYGGVHTNSGIPNRAFYLAASQICGGTWESPGRIWVKALATSNKDDDFSIFAGRTYKAAKDCELSEPVCDLVAKAWTTVGVNPTI